jgi:hypothetical protein
VASLVFVRYNVEMARTTLVTITDDLDGSTDAETHSFSIDGNRYEIDLNAKNFASLENALDHFVKAARKQGAARGRVKNGSSGAKTLLSTLDVEEKDRFRAWGVKKELTTPTARRVADSAVQAWIEAGRP